MLTRVGFWLRDHGNAVLIDGGQSLHHILAQVAAEFESLEANRQSFPDTGAGDPHAEVTELDGAWSSSLLVGVAFQMFNAAFQPRYRT